MSGADYERELKDLLEDLDLRVIRSAGSMGEGDLVCLDPSGRREPAIIEVKSIKGSTYYSSSSSREKEQFSEYERKSKQDDRIEYIYAVRWKGLRNVPETERWSFYRTTVNEDGILRKGEGISFSKMFRIAQEKTGV